MVNAFIINSSVGWGVGTAEISNHSLPWLGFEPLTSRLTVKHANHYTSVCPLLYFKYILWKTQHLFHLQDMEDIGRGLAVYVTTGRSIQDQLNLTCDLMSSVQLCCKEGVCLGLPPLYL